MDGGLGGREGKYASTTKNKTAANPHSIERNRGKVTMVTL